MQEITERALEYARKYIFPLIERLKPEIVFKGEDLGYNHGMLISPEQFDKFFGQGYREVCDCAASSGVEMVGVDSDGNIMELTEIFSRYGVNGLFPCEVKAGNDLFTLRKKHQKFIFCGWLEKEVLNAGNANLIEKEIIDKAIPMMKEGYYFPNTDHFIQPLASFENLCKFMTLLHDVCRNPEGKFPRMNLK